MIEDWSINCGEWDWTGRQVWFDIISEPEQDWQTTLHVQFNVEDFGVGNPLADNPWDYYGGIYYDWILLDDKVLKENFCDEDRRLISYHIDETIESQIKDRRKR